MSNIAVKVENLSKMYRLGVINNGTFFRDVQSWIAIKTGKEDPHSKIGDEKYKGDKDHFWALKNISFEIEKGDRVAFIGKNGAGKSTILKLLSRISSPTEGIIKIKGKIASLLEVGTGFHGELTGRENIYLNGAILGMKVHSINKKIDEIISFCGIEHHIDTPVKRYSSGMFVRLAFAVAAHLDSDILIADEVLAVGDAEFQKKALGKMEDLSFNEGRTVLFVSHNISAVEKLCNKGIVLDKGKILKTGNISNCISFYTDMTIPPSPTEIKSECLYVINEELPYQIEKIELINKNGLQNSVFEAQEEIKVRISFISRNPIPNVYSYFFIKMENGENIINCYSLEDEKDIFNNMQPGKYVIELVIMKGLLTCGEYTVNIGFGGSYLENGNGEQYINALRFKVIDSLFFEPKHKRNSITSTILEWKVTEKRSL